ncbi:hypothetical protein IFM89_032114 [Coptis chinensis]|uniref:non-specific serine/threonine protein kinase n=1 Tax=Coptis chinensis TaxID=261450 RepID=A0A835IS19_9MAGN|nr:hypothetical protein IFM89_032114 [Coptis chinensis]
MAGYLPLPFDVKSNISDQKDQINKADFTCPSWFSSSAKNLIKRILDPNPLTEYLVTEKKENPVSMNAFEFISRSQCFDLGSLYEKQEVLSLGYKRFPVM